MSDRDRRPILEWCLRRGDQAALAIIIVGSGIVLAATMFWQIQLHQRWIDIDRDVAESIEFRVDINQASWSELALLPGVGETVARNLVQFRQQHGRFETLKDLLRVPGIGTRTLERLQHHLEPLGDGSEPQPDVDHSRRSR